jgi:hypothetical protein
MNANGGEMRHTTLVESNLKLSFDIEGIVSQLGILLLFIIDRPWRRLKALAPEARQ